LIAVSRSDPHHGRWILPLVIAGLVGFTYLFVNALPPAPVNGTDDTVVDGGTGTTLDGTTGTDGTGTDGATTTTTVAADVQAFISAVDDFAVRTAQLAQDAQRINDDWDARTVGLTPTTDALTQLQAQTSDLVSEIGEVAVPPGATDAWATVSAAASTLNTAALDMYDGLVNSPTADQRLGALETYTTTAADLATSYEAAKAAAGA
jgi:hypothetical protein